MLEGHKHYPLSFRRLIFQKNMPQIAPVWVKSRLIEGMGVEVVLFSCCNFGAVIWGIEIYFNKSCGSELNPKINAWNSSQSGTILLRRSEHSEMQVPNTWLFSTSRECWDNMWVLLGFWGMLIWHQGIGCDPQGEHFLKGGCYWLLSDFFVNLPMKKEEEDGIPPSQFPGEKLWERFLCWILCWEPKHPLHSCQRFGPRRGDRVDGKICTKSFHGRLLNGHIGFRYIWHPELFFFGRWVLQPSMPSGH